MNRVFKIKRNALGQSIVTSELAKSCGKGKTLAALIMLSLLSLGVTNPALATPSTIGTGNLVTGEKGVADGYNNIVTAVKGTAQGNDSIATGNNLSRNEFSAKLNEYNDLLSDKTLKEGEIGTIGTNIEANNQAQNNLNEQIRDLNKIIDRANAKSDQLDNLNNQLTLKQSELTPLFEELERAKQNAQSSSATGSGDKTVWTDFTSQLSKLDWNKLSDSSSGTSGVNKLATDLKGMVEADYPDYTNKWEINKYEEVISGYINRQGLFDANEDAAGVKYTQNRDYYSFKFDISGPKYVGNVFEYNTTTNIGTTGALSLVNYLERVSEVLSSEININTFNNLRARTYVDIFDGNNKDAFYSFYNLKNIINSETNNAIQDIAKSYKSVLYRYYKGYGAANGASDLTNAVTVLHLPPVDKKSSVEFVAQKDLANFVKNTFKNELGSIDNGIVSDQNTKAFISNTDINYLRDWVSLFYDNFYNNIDFNATDSSWLFDKDSYVTQLSKVENFASKLKEYVVAYDSAIANPSDLNAQVKLVSLYNDIRQSKDNDENYYEHIKVNLKQSTIDLFNQYAVETAKELTEDAQKLKLYDVRNEVIKGVITAAQDLQNDIDKAQKAIEAKQREIDDINQEVKDLALTPDEQGAADLKSLKEKDLADKQAEKTQLEQDKTAKQAELDEINRKLNETNLANLGKNSISVGVDAFSSGNDSIAIGTNSTVTANDGISIGRDSNVSGAQSIALGADNTVSGEKSIAIGVGHNVSGNHSTTIGDPNTISGDDVFVAGNNNTVASNNVMVMGNNINVNAGFDGAVVLGANSEVTQANAVESHTVGGTKYTFAGTAPTSTVSVGAVGAERQITNVAAGRISETSTDAINGSQLYALADAIEKKSLNPADVADEVVNQIRTKLVAGDHITIDEDTDTNTFTISGKPATTITAGKNVTVTGNPTDGYVISAKGEITNDQLQEVIDQVNNIVDTNTQSVTKAGKGVKVEVADNTQGTKDYTVSVKLGAGLAFDKNGNVVNDVKINGGKAVTVTGDAKTGYTIDAAQNTVTGGKGVGVTESDNADGSKNYTVETKIGKGLTYGDNGEIVATAQAIKGGDGVTITENNHGEQVVNIAGVSTTTDDGKSYTRQNLTQPVGIKGDGKNIKTSTATNGDVQVGLVDDLKVNSVTTGSVSISKNGVNAGGKKVTNVATGEISPTSTDAVNGSQLHATNMWVMQNTQNVQQLGNRVNHLDNKINKVNKEARAGIAGAAAIAGLPEIHLAGKSMVSASASTYKGEQAVAVGYSRLSDNSKVKLKLSGSANMRGDVIGTVGVGYAW